MEEEIVNFDSYNELNQLMKLVHEKLDSKFIMHALVNQPIIMEIDISKNGFIPHKLIIISDDSYMRIEKFLFEKWRVSFDGLDENSCISELRVYTKRYAPNFAMTYYCVEDDEKLLEIIDKYFILK